MRSSTPTISSTTLPACPSSRYRYNIAGWSLGGPVFIPKHFNVGKTKIFFFASQEYTRQLANFGNQFRSMPTAAERTGDFSHSVTGANALIPVLDPLNLNAAGAATQFPGNIVPQNRINGWGQAMLNFFPLPNTVFAPGNRSVPAGQLPGRGQRRASPAQRYRPSRPELDLEAERLYPLGPRCRRLD